MSLFILYIILKPNFPLLSKFLKYLNFCIFVKTSDFLPFVLNSFAHNTISTEFHIFHLHCILPLTVSLFHVCYSLVHSLPTFSFINDFHSVTSDHLLMVCVGWHYFSPSTNCYSIWLSCLYVSSSYTTAKCGTMSHTETIDHMKPSKIPKLTSHVWRQWRWSPPASL